MANQDSFIDEVNEEVRRDRLFAIFRRYGWIAVLVILLIVGGAAWNEWRKATAAAEAEARGDAVFAALSVQAPEARLELLDEFNTGESADLAALIGLFRAGIDLEMGDQRQAAEDLAAVASAPQASAVYRDLASLKSILAAGTNIPPEERIAQLQGMALPGAPFRLLAEEQIALAEIERGNIDTAITQLEQIAADQTASQGLRRRALQMIVAVGGSPAN